MASRWLHVHAGDASRAVLERSGLPGEHVVWAETLHEGPVRGTLPRPVWREDRARFYASLGPAPPGQPPADALLARWDAGLERHTEADEVILWFEHDLFDQLCLVHHLDLYAGRQLGTTALSLVCIGEHPDVPGFRGLGELSPDAMAALVETRRRVTREQEGLARRAWRALVAEDPGGLVDLARDDTGALPFLGAALLRFLEEYPSLANGLSRTERQVLDVLADGASSCGALFAASQDREESPFMGDLLFWAVLTRLAAGDHPLLVLGPGERMAAREARLTSDGEAVRCGERDAVALRGIDLWRGGVHLEGRAGVWRWDADVRSLVRR